MIIVNFYWLVVKQSDKAKLQVAENSGTSFEMTVYQVTLDNKNPK